MLETPQDTKIMGCHLILTCYACPEQYNVEFQGAQIGYLRLRHGIFTATYPNVLGKIVYRSSPMGDGIFEPQERLYQLTKAIQALLFEHASGAHTIEIIPGVFVELTQSDLINLQSRINQLLEPK